MNPQSQPGEVVVTEADQELVHQIDRQCLPQSISLNYYIANQLVAAHRQAAVTVHVLGHPATEDWCKAVDSHHAATEDVVKDLRSQLAAQSVQLDQWKSDYLRMEQAHAERVQEVLDLRKANEGMSAACAKSDAEIDRLAKLLSFCHGVLETVESNPATFNMEGVRMAIKRISDLTAHQEKTP